MSSGFVVDCGVAGQCGLKTIRFLVLYYVRALCTMSSLVRVDVTYSNNNRYVLAYF